MVRRPSCGDSGDLVITFLMISLSFTMFSAHSVLIRNMVHRARDKVQVLSKALTAFVAGLITLFNGTVYQYQFRLQRLIVEGRKFVAPRLIRSKAKGLADCVDVMPSITPSFLVPFSVASMQ